MRHKGWKNKGGTTDGALALDLRPASHISRKRWHARKRHQMIVVWKNNDYDSLVLLGAANRDRIARYKHKLTKVPINSAKWFEKKENQVPVESTTRRKRRAKPAQVGK